MVSFCFLLPHLERIAIAPSPATRFLRYSINTTACDVSPFAPVTTKVPWPRPTRMYESSAFPLLSSIYKNKPPRRFFRALLAVTVTLLPPFFTSLRRRHHHLSAGLSTARKALIQHDFINVEYAASNYFFTDQVVSKDYMPVERNFIRLMELNSALTRQHLYLMCLDGESFEFFTASMGIRCLPLSRLHLSSTGELWGLRVHVVSCLVSGTYSE